jgi:hypothetical protein
LPEGTGEEEGVEAGEMHGFDIHATTAGGKPPGYHAAWPPE